MNLQGENAFWNVEDRSRDPRRGPSVEILASAQLQSADFARDGELFITREFGVASVWNVETGKRVGSVEAIEGSSVGQYLAASNTTSITA
jgi:hypothetical protein